MRAGLLANLIIVPENPIANLKVLQHAATGAISCCSLEMVLWLPRHLHPSSFGPQR